MCGRPERLGPIEARHPWTLYLDPTAISIDCLQGSKQLEGDSIHRSYPKHPLRVHSLWPSAKDWPVSQSPEPAAILKIDEGIHRRELAGLQTESTKSGIGNDAGNLEPQGNRLALLWRQRASGERRLASAHAG